jgi:tetratricopeptide (TPR) repeat protein
MTDYHALRAATLSTVLGIVSLAVGAEAQDVPNAATVERAHSLFRAAEQAYDAHRYATAAGLFRQVHELMAGHPRQYLVLFNLGQCLADSGQYEEAIASLRQYLSEGGDRVENRGEVETRIAQLEDLLASREEARAGPEEQEAPSGPDEGLAIGSAVGFASGAAGLAAMAIFGGLALAEHDALADGCGATTSCTTNDIETSDTFALVADVMLGVGAAGVAAGLGLLIAALASGDSGEADQASFELAPWVAANALGLTGVTTW